MISYLLPTRNRRSELQATLAALGRLSADAHKSAGGAEVIIVDNASRPPVVGPPRLDNGLPVLIVHQDSNTGASARNVGAAAARGHWLIMLDDDSYPLDSRHLRVIAEATDSVAAIGAEIRLPDGSREAGGLPEVFVGCGAAVRREAFLSVGGYDAAFRFYAEEYDLCAKLLRAGWWVVHDLRFRVLHRKVADGRDKNLILRHLVRNNGWVMQRYAPPDRREGAIREVISRYARIAVREGASKGYAQGIADLVRTLARQPARQMSGPLFDRFVGLAEVRATLGRREDLARGTRAAIVDEGKNASVVRQVVRELGLLVTDNEGSADVAIIGTLSPGPMLDARDRRASRHREPICPWDPRFDGLLGEI